MNRIRNVVFLMMLFCAAVNCGKTQTGDQPPPTGARPELTITLSWLDNAGVSGESVIADKLDPSGLQFSSLWFMFRDHDGKLNPVALVNGQLTQLAVDAKALNNLSLLISYRNGDKGYDGKRILFDTDRVMGCRSAHKDNVYCLTISAPAAGEPLPDDIKPAAMRVMNINQRYTADADRYMAEISTVFKIAATRPVPRFLLAAEEWLELPQKKKASGGGLFGAALDETIFGGEPTAAVFAPAYSLDVLHDEVETAGKNPEAFNTARSIYNDVLEGKVIYEITGGKRRVLTATVVFGQMTRNKEEKGIENNAVVVTADTPGSLDQCVSLWPAAREEILEFLKDNRDWKVIIPRLPVLFFDGKNPAYALYAWYRVHPQSGRIIGMLPSGLHGASEEWAAIQETLVKEAMKQLKGQIEDKTGGAEGGMQVFFSTVAGMYVSSAGILDGVRLTIANPDLAALDGKSWEEFLASHSIAYSRKFLEANADLYDSYSSRVGFWAGVAAITANFSDKDAAKSCLENAWSDIKNKIIEDAKKWADTGGPISEALARAGEEAETAKEIFDQVRSAYTGIEDASDPAKEIIAHVENIIKEKMGDGQ